MKNYIFICVLLCFQFGTAQNRFDNSNKYLVTTHISDQDNKQVYTVDLRRTGDNNQTLSTLTIEDTELFEDIFITTLENPGLEGVSEVIKLEIEYLACCAHVESYYFMVSSDGQVTPLPQVNNVYCEDTDMDYQYIFPNQEYGVAGNILETQTFYTPESKVKYVNLKQSLSWNGADYEHSKTTAITSY